MKTEFTKGNWKIDTSEDYKVSVVSPWSKDVTTDNFSTFADYRGALICEMHYNTGVPTKETAVANAKLISAAPELLQNCVWVRNNFLNILPIATKEEALEIYAHLLDSLEAAIEKATK